MGSLKAFIKAVRKSKTIAEERAVVRKEGAKIRASFRDSSIDNSKRRKNIQKLLYLYIIGEPTYFGQVECLKLLASAKFTDKRVGYMATMLILDESQDILTLLTNCLDLDMKSNNNYVVGLALCCLGNVTSAELAKDLYPDVEKLTGSKAAYIKKKAVVVASKLVEKEPVLSEVFLPYLTDLLNERSHGVLLATSNLIDSIYFNDNTSHSQLLQLLPKIVSHIKLLISSGYSAEYDVKSIPDPFLIVALLKNIRILLSTDHNNGLEGSSHVNFEMINDLLTQICAKFENSKHAGYTILYEAVRTIFSINSDSSLKVLGVNILSKLLIQKDNNVKYVALDTLLQVIDFEPLAVQRHRTMIVTCLFDGDITIRRRALELTFGILNHQNVRLLTKELLKYLEYEDNDELKLFTAGKLPISLIQFNNDNAEYNLETMISMLNVAGNCVTENILSTILAMIMQNSNKRLTKQILLELVAALKKGLYDQYGLLIVTVWTLGEYSDLILDEIKESEILEIVDTILTVSTYSNEQQKIQMMQYILTCCIKLSIKINTASLIERLRQIIKSYTHDINLEIQSRAIEYLSLFEKPLSIKRGLLERMPAPSIKKSADTTLSNRTSPMSNISSNDNSSKSNGDLLLDLLGDDIISSNGNSKSGETAKSNMENVQHASTMDLLADIFGASTINKPSDGNVSSASQVGTSMIKDQLQHSSNTAGLLSTTPENGTRSEPPSSIEAFNDGHIAIGFIEKNIQNGAAEIECVVRNIGKDTVTNISILCAVSKQQKLQLSSIPKTTLGNGDFSVLSVKISGKEGSKIKIRVKLSYMINGAKADNQFDFAEIKTLL